MKIRRFSNGLYSLNKLPQTIWNGTPPNPLITKSCLNTHISPPLLPKSDDEDFQLAFVTLDFCRPLVLVTLDCPRLPRCLLLQRQYRSTKGKAHKCQMRPMRSKKAKNSMRRGKEKSNGDDRKFEPERPSTGKKTLQSNFQNAASGHIITL